MRPIFDLWAPKILDFENDNVKKKLPLRIGPHDQDEAAHAGLRVWWTLCTNGGKVACPTIIGGPKGVQP